MTTTQVFVQANASGQVGEGPLCLGLCPCPQGRPLSRPVSGCSSLLSPPHTRKLSLGSVSCQPNLSRVVGTLFGQDLWSRSASWLASRPRGLRDLPGPLAAGGQARAAGGQESACVTLTAPWGRPGEGLLPQVWWSWDVEPARACLPAKGCLPENREADGVFTFCPTALRD